jgi:serine/threonine-protein kinase
MTDEAHVQQLLDEIFESGKTPEAVCRDCPGLLSLIRERWQQMRHVEAELDVLFPTPRTGPYLDTPPGQNLETDLPRIPGYEVETVLGRGGMGIVFRAIHLRLNRPVAVKMMLAGSYAGLSEKARFQREAEAVAKLRHPNIVQVYDVGDVDGRSYFTMEFIEGGSLAKKLAGTPQPAKQAAQLVATLAGAMQAAHESGIVHRDLKPANVLLTADGTPDSPTPKIADFGIARRLEGTEGPNLTLEGTPIGTASYMAPEQALGVTAAPADLCARVDVYALGAILYESLTGRPPFRAATAAETVQQVISQEPAPPSRLNDKVPRDLETICLKCLHKEPGRRYASAAELADDLRRFGEGRPIQARPLGWGARFWRWCRRNPMAAALVATALVLVGVASGGGVWFVQQRAERRAEAAQRDLELRNEIGTAVAQAVNLRQGFHFHEARELLEQARQRLEPAGPDDLRRQAEQCRADLDLAELLDAARLARLQAAAVVGGRFDPARVEPQYASAFAEAGLGREGDDSEAVAARVRESAVRAEIVAALDDWASITPDRGRRAWLLAVARKADPDPARDRLRQPELWEDGVRLTRLARELSVAEVSPQLAAALGRVALESGGDVVALLTTAQARFPHNFWLNFELGAALHKTRRLDEALGYGRAALALRPSTSAANNSVGFYLRALGRVDEAIDYYRQALRLDPRYAVAHNNLGAALQSKGRLDDAVDHFQQALRIDPGFAVAHNNLGDTLYTKGRVDEAIDHFQQAVRLDPQNAVDHNNLGVALLARGRLDEALGQFEEAVRIDPSNASAHTNLGFILRAKGRVDEAIDHHQLAVRLDPKLAAAHFNLGGALRAKGRLDEAIEQFQQALGIKPSFAVAHFSLADALRAKGRLEEAIDHLQQAVQHDPKLSGAQTTLGHAFYDAARGAIRDLASQGTGEGRLSEPERADKRRRALGWLRANMELRTTMLNDGKAVVWSLATWQTDPALASVGDPAALAKLPDAEREQWQRLWEDVAAQVAADPLEQGRARAARRGWAEAADGYARALKRGPTDDGHFWFEYAAVLLLSGDRAGYARACAHMVDRCAKPGGSRPYHVARACTLAPDVVADPALPGQLAEKEFRESAKQFWSLTEQGALAYRAGRFQEAATLFQRSLKADPKPGKAVVNWLWLALAYQQLDKPDEARRWLNKAGVWIDQFDDGLPAGAEQEFGLHLHNWLEANVLRREAESLLPPQ